MDLVKIRESIKISDNDFIYKNYSTETQQLQSVDGTLTLNNVVYIFRDDVLADARYLKQDQPEPLFTSKATSIYKSIKENFYNYDVEILFHDKYHMKSYSISNLRKNIKCNSLLICEILRKEYPDYKIIYNNNNINDVEYPMMSL